MKFLKTHMLREDIDFTEEQLVATEYYLLRAERSSNLARKQLDRIEAIEQLQKAFENAEQFRQEFSVSPESSLYELLGENPFSLELPINDLNQIIRDIEYALALANFHQKTATLKVEGMLTPTAKVREFKKRMGEAANKITDLMEDLQQTNKFLSYPNRDQKEIG